jgi:hypothetical protein
VKPGERYRSLTTGKLFEFLEEIAADKAGRRLKLKDVRTGRIMIIHRFSLEYRFMRV